MAPSTSPCSIINSTCTKSHTQIKSQNKSGDNSHRCVVAFFVACFMSVPTEPYQHIRKRAGFFWKRAINYWQRRSSRPSTPPAPRSTTPTQPSVKIKIMAKNFDLWNMSYACCYTGYSTTREWVCRINQGQFYDCREFYDWRQWGLLRLRTLSSLVNWKAKRFLRGWFIV